MAVEVLGGERKKSNKEEEEDAKKKKKKKKPAVQSSAAAKSIFCTRRTHLLLSLPFISSSLCPFIHLHPSISSSAHSSRTQGRSSSISFSPASCSLFACDPFPLHSRLSIKPSTLSWISLPHRSSILPSVFPFLPSFDLTSHTLRCLIVISHSSPFFRSITPNGIHTPRYPAPCPPPFRQQGQGG